MNENRREFLKTLAFGGVSLSAMPALNIYAHKHAEPGDALVATSSNLLEEWSLALLNSQLKGKKNKSLNGGFLCPACCRVHGRSSDAIYPFMYMAQVKNDERYLAGAKNLFDWAEHNVSYPQGFWVNDVNISLWRGTTVFKAIALAEAIIYHGSILDATTLDRWSSRLFKAAEYIYSTFDIDYGNINYPVSGAYAMALSGRIFNEKKFTDRGDELAVQCMDFFSPNDHLLYGEGPGKYEKTPKGCVPVDLGYNVGESLPFLAQYAHLTTNDDIKNRVIISLKQHLEFMMPDGGWDNSWGTRNYKWTYWGSRTTDGSPHVYAMLSAGEPLFYKAALRNLELLEKCTHRGLLHGGPHYVSHNVSPCIHHTFCHAKALTALLNHKSLIQASDVDHTVLPREKIYGAKEFKDLYTWLISTDYWAGTITGYDSEYTRRNGHPTGGSLSILWHRKAGLIMAASMNEYQMWEASNMQMDKDPFSMPLTPRLEYHEGGTAFMSISDLGALIENTSYDHNNIVFSVKGRLVDRDQRDPGSGPLAFSLTYKFENEKLRINYSVNGTELHKYNTGGPSDLPCDDRIKFVMPVISASSENQVMNTLYQMVIIREKSVRLRISSKNILRIAPASNGRIFNYVPGLSAIPVVADGAHNEVVIEADC